MPAATPTGTFPTANGTVRSPEALSWFSFAVTPWTVGMLAPADQSE